MSKVYKICLENFKKVGEAMTDYLSCTDELSDNVEEVRVDVSMGEMNDQGIDVEWFVEFDHNDQFDVPDQSAHEVMFLVSEVLFDLEDSLRGYPTPHLNAVIKNKKNDTGWSSDQKIKFLRGWILKTWRFIFKR